MVDISCGSEPFGSYAPRRVQLALMEVGRRFPRTWGGRRLALPIRSALKRTAHAPIGLTCIDAGGHVTKLARGKIVLTYEIADMPALKVRATA